MKNKPIVVLCTVPDNDCAQIIANALVKKEIAACCNIIPGIKSIYKWENKVQEDSELLLIIKSAEINFNSLKDEIEKLHPYEVPEIISLDISLGSEKYLDWIFRSFKGKNAH